MKKLVKVLLLILLLINLFSSFAYAGPMDFPRPDSVEPTTTTMDISNN